MAQKDTRPKRKQKEPRGMAPCGCGRVGDGYALVLCQEHAPIPYALTDRGRRDIRHLRQWDAIEGMLRTQGTPRTQRLLKISEAWRATSKIAKP